MACRRRTKRRHKMLCTSCPRFSYLSDRHQLRASTQPASGTMGGFYTLADLTVTTAMGGSSTRWICCTLWHIENRRGISWQRVYEVDYLSSSGREGFTKAQLLDDSQIAWIEGAYLRLWFRECKWRFWETRNQPDTMKVDTNKRNN